MSRAPRVVLYNPDGETFVMPLGVLAVGSYLRARGYAVEIFDGRLDRDGFFNAIQTGELLAIGVSVLTGKPIEDAIAASRRAKEIRPETPVVWGGWHPSILPEQCLALDCVDYAVVGQGELTFHELLERLRRGETAEGCPGVAFKAAGLAVKNPARPMADLEALPPLDYELIDVPAYFALKGKRQLDYYSSQGCPYQCTFCADPYVFRRRWESRSAERVVAELLALHRRYGVEDVFFNDDLFFVDRKRLEKVVDGLLAAGSPFTWVAAGRADLMKRYPDELMSRIRQSGCRRVSIGAESGSQAMLEEVKKKLTVEDIYGAAVRCDRFGIQLAFSFMTGFPGEDARVLGETLDLVKRIKRVNGEFETPLFFYYAYPGTELTETLARMGVRLPESIEGWIDFDLYRGNTSWLGRGYQDRVERMNFYLPLAFRRPSSRWSLAGWVLHGTSRLRVELDLYGFAAEMHLVRAVKSRRERTERSELRRQIAFKVEKVCG